MNYSILLVEDSEEDVQTCQTTVERMNDADGELSLSIDSARTIDEAYCKLKSNNYHGAIIDIKIDDGSGKSGNDVVEEIIKTYRLPVAIFTGTPDVKTDDKNRIPVYTKRKKTHLKSSTRNPPPKKHKETNRLFSRFIVVVCFGILI